MGRIACIWIPHFELSSRLRERPELAGTALLLADLSHGGARVIDASEEALQLGVRPQMTVTRARALCPDAAIIPPDGRFLRERRDEVLALLYTLAPVTGRDERESFFIALAGLARLYPDEHALAARISELLSPRGWCCAVAIADDPVSAWVVARAMKVEAIAVGRSWQIVPSGQEAATLAELPLDALPLPDQVLQLCQLLGIDRLAGLQALPPGALAHRFGEVGVRVGLRAQGRSREGELFVVETPLQIESAEIDLDQPSDALDLLTFLHKHVLDRLIKQVRKTRRVIAALELTLRLTDSEHTRIQHTFRPARPTLDARLLLDLILLWLGNGPATDLVEGIAMRAIEVGVLPVRQMQLFEREREETAEAFKLAQSRLVAAFGADAVVYPRLADSLRPEARLAWYQVDERAQMELGAEVEGPALVPVIELLDPPEPIRLAGKQVQIGPAEGGRWLKVVARRGPFRIEGQWWDAGFCREYWLLRTADELRLWIYRDASGSYLQGYLD